MTDFRIDWDRIARTGTREAVLCDAQVDAADRRDRRARAGARSAPAADAPRARAIRALSRCARARSTTTKRRARRSSARCRRRGSPARVAIVCGGTSDRRRSPAKPRARSPSRAKRRSRFVDVGVAGLWRLMERLDEIRAHRIVIAVAGHGGRALQRAGRARLERGDRRADVGGLRRRSGRPRGAQLPRSRAARRDSRSSTSTTDSAPRTSRCACWAEAPGAPDTR